MQLRFFYPVLLVSSGCRASQINLIDILLKKNKIKQNPSVAIFFLIFFQGIKYVQISPGTLAVLLVPIRGGRPVLRLCHFPGHQDARDDHAVSRRPKYLPVPDRRLCRTLLVPRHLDLSRHQEITFVPNHSTKGVKRVCTPL